MNKKCSSCGKEKSINEFGIRNASYDGFTACCLECLRERDKKRYKKDKPKRIALQKMYMQTKEGKISHAKSVIAWRIKNSNKRAAHIILGNAIQSGKIIKTPCEVCGSTEKIHGHHEDYTKPLEVKWLCPQHHKDAHKNVTDC
jgi:hypothetical protein